VERSNSRGAGRAQKQGGAAGGRQAGRGTAAPARKPTKLSGWKEVEKADAAASPASDRRKTARVRAEKRAGKADGGSKAKKSRVAAKGDGEIGRRARGRSAESSGKGARRLTLRSVSPRTVIIGILFVLFFALSASPVARNLEATGKLKAMEKELAKQQKITRSLENEVNEARSLSYIEQEARKERLVAPDEILYLVTTDSEEPNVEYRLKALQSMDEAWEQVRKFLHCNAARQRHSQ
jgi:cell division protein FtsL